MEDTHTAKGMGVGGGWRVCVCRLGLRGGSQG